MASLTVKSFAVSSFPKDAVSESTRTGTASSISCGRGMPLFLGFRGLKVSRLAVKSVALSGRVRACRRLGVVCEAPDTKSHNVEDITSATWQTLVMECETPVLVEFWAPWCGPCRMILPVIEEISKQYAGRLKCTKLNTDASPDIATKLGIRSIPTIMIFKNGEKKEVIIGGLSKSTLIACIDKIF